jgi:hypothetical protein
MIVRQHCCNKNTHYPHKMKSCESIPHTIASYIANDSSIDHIITIEKNKNTLDIKNVKILPKIISDHKPIFCIVNNIPILSWNIEGLCISPEITTERMGKIKKVLSSLHKKYNNIIFLFQEIFLQSEINKPTIQRLKELFYHSDYTYHSDNYTSGIIIPKHLFSNIQFIPRKNSNKNTLVIYIKSTTPFYLVNIHLKSVQSLNHELINHTHTQELNNILNKLKYKFNKGIVFMGDHNNTDIFPIYKDLMNSY